MKKRTLAEPYRIKVVSPIKLKSRSARENAIKKAHFNTYLLDSEDVFIDLLTDAGTNAMSDDQWAGLMIGDEAYAGSRNFYNYYKSVQDVFGYKFMVPTHNGRGAEHLVTQILIKKGQFVPTNYNTTTAKEHIEDAGGVFADVSVEEAHNPESTALFRGNIDLEKLKKLIEEKKAENIAFILMKTCMNVLAGQPFSMQNLKEVSKLAKEKNIPLILDASHIAENCYLIRKYEKGYGNKSIAEMVKEMTSYASICIMSTRQDCFANVGGLIASNDEEFHKLCTSLVVVYEGLFTYGGINGRDMEAISRGLHEMIDESNIEFRMAQIEYLAKKLDKAGIPIIKPLSGDGVYLNAEKFVPHIPREQFPAQALAVALYIHSGVRACERGQVTSGKENKLELVGLCLPRRVYTGQHLDFVAEAVIDLFENKEKIKGLKQTYAPKNVPFFTAEFEPVEEKVSEIPEFSTTVNVMPYKIKRVEPLKKTDKKFREKAAKEAGYNTFLLRSEDIYIDLLTDSGTSAMSDKQWAGVMEGDEAVGSRNYYNFVKAVKDVFGFKYVLPTHQGRAAEFILSQTMIKKGQFVPMNMYFTTTREHAEMAGGIFVDVIVDEAHDPTNQFPFKGNIDLKKLKKLVDEHGAERIAYVSMAPTVNMAAGQPFSMQNIREVSEFLHENNIPLILDATRCAENCQMIKEREKGYAEKSIAEIMREMMGYADGCTMSSKKDILVNIGGFIAVNDKNLFKKLKEMQPMFEGTHRDAGLSGRDMEAHARGCYEMLNEEYIASRVRQTQFLGQMLLDAGIPIMEPVGTHAICLDAKRFLPHIPQDEFPAQALAAELFIDSGVRSMERGIVSAGRDKKTGKHKYPKLELVRLTIPRRVYTDWHMKVVAESVINLYDHRDDIVGLKMVYEPKQLRFFSARFEKLK